MHGCSQLTYTETSKPPSAASAKKKQLDDYTQPEDAQTLCLSSSHLLPEDNASWFCLAFIKRKVIKRGSGAPSSSKLVDSANHWLEKESSLQKH